MFKKAIVVAGAFGMLSVAAPAYAHGPGDITSGRSGVLSGNQLFLPITAPINACGNGVGVAGVGIAGCKGGSSAHVHR
ncbi:chaplin family protein [Nonomuraea sp. NPDC049725]|uniref:chaplin family protein n=1 Tax=Nonomuraea sp. NPDC049725 TaxID=3154508 RepID=UPI003430AC13